MADNVMRFLISGIGLLALYIVLSFPNIKRGLKHNWFYYLMWMLVLVVSVVGIVYIKQEVGDVRQFGKAGYFFRFGSDFYTIDKDHSQYPFFPLMIFLHSYLNKLATSVKLLSFTGYLKIVLLVALNAIGVLIKDRQLRLKFLTNPITYAVVIFHGQIDVLLLLFLILALRYRERWWGGLLLGISVGVKTWSILFLPLILKFTGFWKTFLVGVTSGLFLLLDIFVYTKMVSSAKFSEILLAVTKPGGPVGLWGMSLILKPFAEILAKYNLYIFGGLFLIGCLILWKKQVDIWKAGMLLILWIYLIIPNWGVQYVFWVLPFLFLNKWNRWSEVYVWLAGSYAFLNYINVANEGVLIPLNVLLVMGLFLWGYVGLLFGKISFVFTRLSANRRIKPSISQKVYGS